MTESEIALMKSAQRFALCFNDTEWGDQFKRLDVTIDAWRELAIAAMAYAESQEEKTKVVSDTQLATTEQ